MDPLSSGNQLRPLRERMKVIIDRLFASVALLFLLPVAGLVAIAILIEDGGPVLFRQTRVGRGGILFQILKFRSMRIRSTGAEITVANDPRVTRVGRFLRRLKLDELPQLWNVIRGDMSLVGPRPEVPRYVDFGSSAWQTVLAVRPGITDFASLVYRDEERLLFGQADSEAHYRQVILPAKLKLNIDYIRRQSAWLDLKLMFWTARYSFFPFGFDPNLILGKLF
jgi:lipopolysaccharide/colanic/teichoic acid biosynthesis glycosyltransferase